MAATCLNYLNYIAIATLYVVSIYFAYQPYTEILGFSILFVVNAAFFFFFAGQVSTFNTLFTMLFYSGQIGVAGLFIGLALHFVSFLFIIMMISTLQVKYTQAKGTPLQLSRKYQGMMDTFKANTMYTFSMIFVVLTIILNRERISGTNPIVQKLFAGSTIILSAGIAGISSWNVMISNEFSKLQYRDLTGKK
jgi:hypothetical protein